MIQTIVGEGDFLEKIAGKEARFLLAGSVTGTCEIEGITQAGIPGMIPLTPTLDGEFVDSGKLHSLKEIAKTPSGVPTPAIITRASRNLSGFGFEMLDLGLAVKPHVQKLHHFGLTPSNRIDQGANIDAKAVIQKGIAFGNALEIAEDFVIFGESTPSGTTTARAVVEALGYEGVGEYFSSSFSHAPDRLKERVVKEALSLCKGVDAYTKLGIVGDNMLLFGAGFVSAFSQKKPVILGGGTQMAALLLIIDALKMPLKAQNVALMTTKWVYEDSKSDIEALLKLPKRVVEGYCANFDFSKSSLEILKRYDQGEAKEGVGAGAAICYANMHGIGKEELIQEIERVLVG